MHVLARAHVDVKALKMGIYGFLISAPLGHFLVGTLQKAFAGKTGVGAKIGQILASNLLIAPIQAAGKASDHSYHWPGSQDRSSSVSCLDGSHQWRKIQG